MGGRDESYYYVYSCDLNQRVKIRIGSLEGNVPEKDFEELLNDPIAPFRREQLVLISAEVYSDGVSVALPVHTQPIPGKISGIKIFFGTKHFGTKKSHKHFDTKIFA